MLPVPLGLRSTRRLPPSFQGSSNDAGLYRRMVDGNGHAHPIRPWQLHDATAHSIVPFTPAHARLRGSATYLQLQAEASAMSSCITGRFTRHDTPSVAGLGFDSVPPWVSKAARDHPA